VKVQFAAGFGPIVTDSGASQRFYRDVLGLPLSQDDYPATNDIDGVKHFGLWTLADAAESCFGTRVALGPSRPPGRHRVRRREPSGRLRSRGRASGEGRRRPLRPARGALGPDRPPLPQSRRPPGRYNLHALDALTVWLLLARSSYTH
jgi:catechol 2,3-dioxygenase-like lactoylglutathione lyase family enzyme